MTRLRGTLLLLPTKKEFIMQQLFTNKVFFIILSGKKRATSTTEARRGRHQNAEIFPLIPYAARYVVKILSIP